MIFSEISKTFKNTLFYRTIQVAASEERIAEEVRNFPCIYDKDNRATEKKSEKERMTWGGNACGYDEIIKAI